MNSSLRLLAAEQLIKEAGMMGGMGKAMGRASGGGGYIPLGAFKNTPKLNFNAKAPKPITTMKPQGNIPKGMATRPPVGLNQPAYVNPYAPKGGAKNAPKPQPGMATAAPRPLQQPAPVQGQQPGAPQGMMTQPPQQLSIPTSMTHLNPQAPQGLATMPPKMASVRLFLAMEKAAAARGLGVAKFLQKSVGKFPAFSNDALNASALSRNPILKNMTSSRRPNWNGTQTSTNGLPFKSQMEHSNGALNAVKDISPLGSPVRNVKQSPSEYNYFNPGGNGDIHTGQGGRYWRSDDLWQAGRDQTAQVIKSMRSSLRR